MKTKLSLHAAQEFRARLPQANPHNMTRLLRPVTSFFNGYVFDTTPSSINAGGNHAGVSGFDSRNSGVHLSGPKTSLATRAIAKMAGRQTRDFLSLLSLFSTIRKIPIRLLLLPSLYKEAVSSEMEDTLKMTEV